MTARAGEAHSHCYMVHAAADQLLTTGDAAKLAGVDSQTIRLWEKTGKLVARRTLSGVRLFEREEVLEAMRARADRIERRSGGRG